MSASTKPVFIVGTGRCGTRALYKMLLGTPGVEVHHEYLCTHVQQVAALCSMLQIEDWDVEFRLRRLYGAAVRMSTEAVWVDSSNKASWLLDHLDQMFPKKKFVVLYRDGRRVVSSFFHKLAAECYDDKSTEAMLAWTRGDGYIPPPEKRYWWKIPQPGQPFHEEFRAFDQFQRMCYHWADCNATIKAQLAELSKGSYFEVKLEDLTMNQSLVDDLARFIGVPPNPAYFKALQRPEGVIVPTSYDLTPKQLEQFWAICGPMMQTLGYTGEDYHVKY